MANTACGWLKCLSSVGFLDARLGWTNFEICHICALFTSSPRAFVNNCLRWNNKAHNATLFLLTVARVSSEYDPKFLKLNELPGDATFLDSVSLGSVL